ncbi:MAG: alkane 1-monooxygenase [Sneathiellaceae bacterium]
MAEPATGVAAAMPAAPYFYTPVVMLLALACIAGGGAWPLVLAGWLLFGHAALEWAMGNRFPARNAAPPAEAWPFTLALVLVLPLQAAILAFGLWRLTLAPEGIAMPGPVATLDWIAIALLLGITGGSYGITAAHELVHSRAGWQRAAGIVLLLFAHIPHFRIEHVHNHHPNVGTPLDPATARAGEALHAFIPRSLVGQYRSAWRIEAERMRRRGRPAHGIGNRMIQYLGFQLALDLGVLALFGWAGLAVFLAQALVAVWLLESVNYIEHYGLVRQPLPGKPGRYEPLAGRHCWNAGQAATNIGLYNLGLHSAHHLEASRTYPSLYNAPDMPQLPSGYAGSVLLASVPPLWHRIMAPRLARAVG